MNFENEFKNLKSTSKENLNLKISMYKKGVIALKWVKCNWEFRIMRKNEKDPHID